jgi:hypothetical protein
MGQPVGPVYFPERKCILHGAFFLLKNKDKKIISFSKQQVLIFNNCPNTKQEHRKKPGTCYIEW